MTAMTEANIKLGVILAEAEKQMSSLSAAKLEASGLVPDNIETGMAAQAIAVGAIGKEVAGWKVAINTGRAIGAPILDLYDTTGETELLVPKLGTVSVEVEICFVLAQDIPAPEAGKEYNREDIRPYIASAHLGVELVSYRLVEENKAPFPLFLADRLGNHSFVLGPEIEWSVVERVATQDAALPALLLEGDGETLFTAIPKHPQIDPLEAFVAYANLPLDYLGGFRRGQVVTTGSLCGLVRLSGQKAIRAGWGDIAKLAIKLPA